MVFMPAQAQSGVAALSLVEKSSRNPVKIGMVGGAVCLRARHGDGVEIWTYRTEQSRWRLSNALSQTFADCRRLSRGVAVSQVIPARSGTYEVVRIADVREESPLDALISYAEVIRPTDPVSPPSRGPSTEGELVDRAQLKATVQQLYYSQRTAEQIGELDTLINGLRERRERSPSGIWKLVIPYDGFEGTLAGEGERPLSSLKWNLEKIDKWIAAYPKSPVPRLLRAMAIAHYGIKGLRDPMTVASFPGGADGLRAKIEEGRQYLVANKEIASVDPHYYVLMIQIMRAQRAPFDTILEVMAEGAEKEPAYSNLYFEVARAAGRLSRQPFRDIETLANTAVEKSRGTIGDELYARIYWVTLNEVVGLDRIDRLQWDWGKMRGSMETVLKRYPDQWNVQNFALFSCMAQDKETTKSLVARVEGAPMLMVWGQNEIFDACREWATAALEPAGGSDSRKADFNP